MRRVLIIAMLAALLAGAAAWYARLDAREPGLPAAAPPAAVRMATTDRVSAIGRLEPEHGIRHVAGPSVAAAVVQDLFVDRGDVVRKGQRLATLDTADLQAAVVKEKTAELANARVEYERSLTLSRSQVESDSRRDEWRTRVAVLEAQVARAQAEHRLTQVLAPMDGQVLDVHARAGERVGPDGILELGATHSMFAIAEVYETDVGRVAVGQRARVTSPVLAQELGGVVARIRPKIARHDALGTDPAARKDARVVEVEVRLDDSTPVAALTRVQVEVTIFPTGS